MPDRSPSLETADDADLGADWASLSFVGEIPEEQTAAAIDSTTEIATPAPDDPAEASDGAPDGPARDEKGRFAPKGADASPDAGAATPDGQPTTTTSPAAAAPAAPAQESAARGQPFRYRGAGDTHEFQGAVAQPDGSVTFAPEAVGALREKLGAGEQFLRQTYPRLQAAEREIAELREQRTATEAKSEAALSEVLRIAEIPDAMARATAAIEFIEGLGPRMQQAEAAYWRAEAERARQGRSQPQQVQQQAATGARPDASEVQPHVVETLETAKLDPKYGALTPQDWQALQQRLDRYAPSYVRQVTAEEAQATGLPAGTWAYDEALAVAEIQDMLERVAARTAAETRAKDAARIAKQNAVTSLPSVAVPPSASGATSAPVPAAPVPKDFREFKRSFMKGGFPA